MCKSKDDFVVARSRPRAGLSSILALISAVIISASAGCDRTQELTKVPPAPAGHLATADSPASRLLEQCAGAYTKLTSYSDSARVVLSYKVDGVGTQDVAPLAVAFEHPNRVGLKAYRSTAGVFGDCFRMRLTDEATSPLRGQVVSRALPKRLDLNWLMLDPLAAEYLAAGLAGSPPQLELLLSQQPFHSLLDQAALLSMDGEGIETGTSFDIVKVMRGEAKYRLWIDAKTKLLRRIELPTAALPPEMMSDKRITDIRLSIELDGVSTNTKIDWSQWQVPTASLDQLVRYFVAPPALELDARLSKPIPAFRLEAVAGGEGLDTSRTAESGQIQLLVWLADHPSCQATIQQVSQVVAQLPETIRGQVSATAIWAEPKSASGTTFANLAEKWQIPLPVVIDKEALGRDVLAIREAPTIVVLDRKHKLQFFQEGANPLLHQALPEMLTRLVDGESLAETMLSRAQAERDRHQAQLWLARASDGPRGAFIQPPAYPPHFIQMTKLGEDRVPQNITAMTADDLHNVWLLRANGELEARDARGRIQSSLVTDWTFSDAESEHRTRAVRLTVDAKANFVAISGVDATSLRILDTQTRKTSTLDLGDQPVSDFRWLATTTGSRLAAITAAGRTVLIDPARPQQHSGQSPAQPLAILPRGTDDHQASGYVILVDGRIEPIIVEDTNAAKPTALAKPISAALHSTPSPVVERQLKFTPASGPWSMWHDEKTSATLARGWLAADEPAAFLLDEQLRQLWHAPLPITDDSSVYMSSVAHDPVSGQPLWVVVQPGSTLHFFGLDGTLVDHCQLAEPVRGLALIPSGNEMHLWVAHTRAVVKYRLQISRAQ